MKKRNGKYYKKKCDALITKYFKGKPCVVCNSTYLTCGHHLIPRGHSLYRHDWRNNIVPVCVSHHKYSNEIAAHSANALAVQKFVQFIKRNFPKKYKFWFAHQHDIGYTLDWEERYNRLKKEIGGK